MVFRNLIDPIAFNLLVPTLDTKSPNSLSNTILSNTPSSEYRGNLGPESMRRPSVIEVAVASSDTTLEQLLSTLYIK